jgi:hypothetical protein
MEKLCYHAWNPVHRCWDRAASAEAFSGECWALVPGGKRVMFEYGARILAPYHATDEELDFLLGLEDQ